MPTTPASEDELRARARGGQRRNLGVVFLVVAIGGPLFRYYGFGEHDESLAESLLGSVVGVSIGLAVFLLVTRRRRADGASLYAPLLVLGLPRRQRWAALRALRRGVPSADPVLALAERDSATRVVRVWWVTAAVAAGGAILFLGVTADGDLTAAGHVVCGVLAVLAVSLLVWTVDLRARARRYLDVATPPADI